MPYVKQIDGDKLDIYPDVPEMGESYYQGLGYTLWTDEQVRAFQEQHQPPFDPSNYTYSKYKLKQALVSVGLWDQIKQMMIDNALWEDFLLAQDLSLSDANFSTLYATLKNENATVNIDDILKNSILI